jgi:hypothetical protein
MVGGGKPVRIAGVRQNQGLPRLEITALKKWMGPGSRANRKLAAAVKLTRNARTVEVDLRCPQVRFWSMTVTVSTLFQISSKVVSGRCPT